MRVRVGGLGLKGTFFTMTSLSCRISRTFLNLRQSSLTHCCLSERSWTAGSLAVCHKNAPFATLQSSSHVFSHPVPWSCCNAMLFMKCLQFTTANNSEVLVPGKEAPSINLNQWRTKPPSSTDNATTAIEEIGDVLPLDPLEEISEEEAVQIVAEPLLPPASYKLRHYVERSETLSKLVLLGVDLSKLETRRNVGTYLLKLDFEKDIQKTLLFLKDVGVEDGQLGPFITINPFIFSEDTEELQSRVAYLESKKFKKYAIARMVSRAPYLLNFSVERLDNRLGFFQKELQLNPQKTRDLVTRYPRMLTGSLEPIKENLKVCKIEMGFRDNEIQHMVTCIPKILTGSKRRLTEIFDYVHNKMNIPHYNIAKFPQVFNTRLLKLKERHLFLTFLGRAQYDSAQPNYISLERLVSLPAEVFCEEIAKATIHDFETFLKTL